MSASPPVSDRPLRLDVWLDVACLCKTRSEAQRAVKGGKVEVNGERPKQNREVRPGDTITLTRPLGRKQVIRVLGTCDQHLPKAEARALLFEDITPPPTPEEQAFLQLLKDTRPRGPVVAPDKRERRELRRLKGREWRHGVVRRRPEFLACARSSSSPRPLASRLVLRPRVLYSLVSAGRVARAPGTVGALQRARTQRVGRVE